MPGCRELKKFIDGISEDNVDVAARFYNHPDPLLSLKVEPH